MIDGIQVLVHNCVRIQKDKIIYTDPFKLDKNYNDADIIFITHSHYDHFSPEDIEKVRGKNTIIVVTEDLYDKAKEIGFDESQIIIVKPNEKYVAQNINFEVIPAYNTNKSFHPKENNWVGYIIELDGKKYYIAGDTDIAEEAKNVVCDVAFVPVGGTYTMTAKEAAELVNIIKPTIAVPVHYGSIVGTKEDAIEFEKYLSNATQCRIML